MARHTRSAPPPLVLAAEALHRELEVFERVSAEALSTKLDSQKHLERAGRLLTEVCDAEARLQAQVGELVGAISAARDRQQEAASQIQEWAQELAGRSETFRELLARLEGLAPEATAIAETVKGDAVDLADVRSRLQAIVERAAALESDAAAADFHDLARHGRARKEQLQATIARLDRLPSSSSSAEA